ncbi:MAG: hypothetical protein J0H49_17660 [Acidobacteria bacterium]|nr:hypothetical protein [Acidobacteriota bacterium]
MPRHQSTRAWFTVQPLIELQVLLQFRIHHRIFRLDSLQSPLRPGRQFQAYAEE